MKIQTHLELVTALAGIKEFDRLKKEGKANLPAGVQTNYQECVEAVLDYNIRNYVEHKATPVANKAAEITGKHPDVLDWEVFEESGEGKGCLNPAILKDDSQKQYLRNRVQAAFYAGIKARENRL